VSHALTVAGLRKRYGRRSPWALDGLDCHVPRGALCGLVGPNGAGKTTLYSVACGFLPPDEGSVDLLGEGSFDAARFKGRIGVLPQDAEIQGRLTCAEFLRYMGSLQGLTSARVRQETERVLAGVRLDDRRDSLVGSLSHGMRRRLSVASALLGEPELVLLDEPTAGLDPVQAAALRDELLALRGTATLIVSSHNLVELERICDWVILMEAGRCVRQGTVAEVTGQQQVVTWQLASGDVPLTRLREALPDHGFDVEGSSVVQRAPGQADLDASAVIVARILCDAGIAVRGLQRGRSLEESFLATTDRAGATPGRA
jgi:ABC-2 type transport system ATP-binding protein